MANRIEEKKVILEFLKKENGLIATNRFKTIFPKKSHDSLKALLLEMVIDKLINFQRSGKMYLFFLPEIFNGGPLE